MNLEEIGIMLLIPLGLVVAYVMIRTAARNGTREALREQERAAEAATRHVSRQD